MSTVLPLICTAGASYAAGLAALLYSARKHTDARVMLDVRILDGGLDAADIAALERALERAGGPFRFMVSPAPAIDGVIGGNTRSSLYFARLMIPELFSDLKRALYLDADIVVRRDLARLLSIDFNGEVACAVRDLNIPTVGTPQWENLPYEEFGVPANAPYFNTGVLWMNLEAWRSTNFGDRVLTLSRERADFWKHQDQSPLNLLLYQRCIELPESWNRQVFLCKDKWCVVMPGPAILHFFHEKPWSFPLERPVGVVRVFKRYLKGAGWEHRQPVPKWPDQIQDSLAQRTREIAWMGRRALSKAKRALRDFKSALAYRGS